MIAVVWWPNRIVWQLTLAVTENQIARNDVDIVAQSLAKVLNFMIRVIRSFRKRVDDM